MEIKEPKFVCVSFEDEKKLYLPCNSNGNLDINVVKEYFPSAVGLTYLNGDQERVVEKDDSYFKPPSGGWGTQTYSILSIKKNESQGEDRIKKIMAAIREQKRQVVEEKSKCVSKKVKYVKTSHNRILKLHVGWFHQNNDGQYTQVKRPSGGIRIITVKENDKITVPLLVNIIKNEFFNENLPSQEFSEENLVFNLGLFDKTIITEFENEKGEPCYLNEYLKCNSLKPSKRYFYIFTVLKNSAIYATNTCNISSSRKELKVCGESFLDNLIKFEIEYFQVNTSPYTNSTSLITIPDENGCVEHILSRHHVSWSKTKNVLHFGFNIRKISYDNHCFLQINYDTESNVYEHQFPSVEGEVVPHSLLYDIDDMVGLYGEVMGLCIITSCTYECRPIYSWYCDGNIFDENQMMYFIKVFKNGMYNCEVKCKYATIKSKFFTVSCFENKKQLECITTNTKNTTIDPCNSLPKANEQTEKSLLPVISKDDLIITRKILGVGAQGKVFEGIWLGTEVAVKTIRTGQCKTTSLNEINVYSQIRHPNVVQLMGYSYGKNSLHIIMELVKGDTLYDIIFDDEIKQLYELDELKKKKIALQICQAVNYLHKHVGIIHRDLKPANILISKMSLDVKICDLGLSSTLSNLSILSKTTRGAVKGTPMYMPPELYLRKKPASFKSDMWSLGCLFIELFSERDVWQFYSDDCESELKSKMLNFETPDLAKVPSYLQSIIHRCFSYEPNQRPDTEMILEVLKSNTR